MYIDLIQVLSSIHVDLHGCPCTPVLAVNNGIRARFEDYNTSFFLNQDYTKHELQNVQLLVCRLSNPSYHATTSQVVVGSFIYGCNWRWVFEAAQTNHSTRGMPSELGNNNRASSLAAPTTGLLSWWCCWSCSELLILLLTGWCTLLLLLLVDLPRPATFSHGKSISWSRRTCSDVTWLGSPCFHRLYSRRCHATQSRNWLFRFCSSTDDILKWPCLVRKSTNCWKYHSHSSSGVRLWLPCRGLVGRGGTCTRTVVPLTTAAGGGVVPSLQENPTELSNWIRSGVNWVGFPSW